MSERNYSRVVLAEDEPDRAMEMTTLLEKLGSFDVRNTRKRKDIIKLLDESQAGWLLLDLNLEDGNSSFLVPEIRKKYGKDLFIIVLSGYFDSYPEYELLAMGVDLYLRKPYSAKAMLMQMEKLKERGAEKMQPRTAPSRLHIGEGQLEIETGIYTVGQSERNTPKNAVAMIRLLATSYSNEGWEFVSKINIIGNVWGEEYERDPEFLSQRLRRTRSDAKRFFGVDIIEGDRGYSSTAFRLSREIRFVD